MAETPIPEPRGYPLIGNIAEINDENPIQDFLRLADTYGEIYRLNLAGRSVVVISSNALVHEACSETKFHKNASNVLGEVRNGVHDGLFTAHDEEANWGIAHRILVPAFGPTSIRGMFDDMHDLATQLAMKWARHGPKTAIPVADDFTRLTLDTIALCAMDYRFNSFYREDMHPFLQAMAGFLKESGNRSRRPKLVQYLFSGAAEQQYWADIELLRRTADEVLQARKSNPSDRKDLLTAMLKGIDPRTGQKMSDQSITDNLITFLIAGHETTSGMLSFAFYELLKNPDAYRKAQQEVDEVLGRGPAKVEHIGKLPYINAVLRETLRLRPTIPAISRQPREDYLFGGKYRVHKDENVVLLLGKAHLDPVVYGDDVLEFKPERLLDAEFERLQREFPDSWKPFGNGSRACIGRPFAWQEAVLALAMLLQNFNFVLDDPGYQLQTKETLTIKPKNFFMRAMLRHDMSPTELEHRLSSQAPPDSSTAAKAERAKALTVQSGAGATGKPLSIYYGSNSGTCEAFAQRLAADAPSHGFSATVVDPLDATNEKLPTDQPVVIVTASYEGQPPDNAAHFVSWIESLKGQELAGVNYAVYGCGHHDWALTFHRVPKLVDAAIARLGGERIVALGTTDAADRDMFSDFETWEDDVLWPALAKKYGAAEADEAAASPGLNVEVTHPRTSALRQDVQEAVVAGARELVGGANAKRHLEVRLPTGMKYAAGDYLAVLPLNPPASVSRAMRRFHLAWDACLTVAPDRRTALPTGAPVAASDLLSAYVELAQPATKRNILTLAAATTDRKDAESLEKLAGDDYQQVTTKRLSILDLLEEHPSVELPLGAFLAMLPPMRVRQYSISSSPLWNPNNVTLTYSVLDTPSLSGLGQHVGVATSYLSALAPGDKLHVAVRPSHAAFHLPADTEKTPVICIGAGSGLAPFRGFLQERAAMAGAGRALAPAMLFIGSRSEAEDLYADELARWEDAGVVQVRHAYSRAADRAEGCRYVQDRLYRDREEVTALWNRGAKVYICGSREVGKGVEAACIRMALEAKRKVKPEATEEEVRKWWEGIRNERYATDVFD